VNGELSVGIPTTGLRRTSAELNVAGMALVVAGVALLASSCADLTDGADDALMLFVLGVVAVLAGIGLRRGFPMPERITPRSSLRTAAVGLLSLIGVSTAVYIVTGTIANLEQAAMESTSGFTTTALSVLVDPEAHGRGILFWRAATQWIGGFAALATIIAVLPFLGVSGPADPQTRLPTGVSHLTSGHVKRLLGRYAALYSMLSVVGAVMFLLGGMGPFDAVTYAFTTISTGGFSNHAGSFGRFDSALLEWFGVIGMFLGGMSLAVVWSALRGNRDRIVGARELWVYVGLISAATLTIAIVESPGRSVAENLRVSAFTATSAVSSTGHYVTDWSIWEPGLTMMLLILIGIGAMSGSVGGGFRIVRGMVLFSYLSRELAFQLHPRLVRVVRVGREVVPDRMVARVLGYQALYIAAAATGFLALAIAGTDVVTALSGSVSALATYGPGLGELGVGRPVADIGADAVVVMGVLMFAGRIELYPLLDGVVSIVNVPLRASRRLRSGVR
jgi:trk system potassium uptake protein TrkH